MPSAGIGKGDIASVLGYQRWRCKKRITLEQQMTNTKTKAILFEQPKIKTIQTTIVHLTFGGHVAAAQPSGAASTIFILALDSCAQR